MDVSYKQKNATTNEVVDLSVTGNWRLIQEIDEQDLHMIYTKNYDYRNGLVASIYILSIILAFLIVAGYVTYQ